MAQPNYNLGVDTNIPLLSTLSTASQQPAAQTSSGPGILGILQMIAQVSKGDIGGLLSGIQGRQDDEKRKKLAAQKAYNIGAQNALTAGALAAKPSELASPDQIYQAFIDKGASPDDARTNLNFIQSQQKKAEGDSDDILGPYAKELAQGLQGPTKGAIEALVGAGEGSKAFAEAQAERGRQIQASERDLRKQEKAVTTTVAAAQQQLKDFGSLAKTATALDAFSLKKQGTNTKPLTVGDIIDTSLDDPDSLKVFASKHGYTNINEVKALIGPLKQMYENRGPGTFEFFSGKADKVISPEEIKAAIFAEGPKSQVKQVQEAKQIISQGAKQRAEIRAVPANKQLQFKNQFKGQTALIAPSGKVKMVPNGDVERLKKEGWR